MNVQALLADRDFGDIRELLERKACLKLDQMKILSLAALS